MQQEVKQPENLQELEFWPIEVAISIIAALFREPEDESDSVESASGIPDDNHWSKVNSFFHFACVGSDKFNLYGMLAWNGISLGGKMRKIIFKHDPLEFNLSRTINLSHTISNSNWCNISVKPKEFKKIMAEYVDTLGEDDD